MGRCFAGVPLQTTHGFPMLANFHDPSNCRMYERRRDPVIDFISSIPTGSCFIDVGANQGETTVLGARRVGPDGLVLAYEPGRYAFDLLLRNIELNELGNVLPRNEAIASSVRCLCLAMDDVNHTAMAHISSRGESVRAGPLEDRQLLDRLSCLDIYIKIDTEGYEYEVLRGLRLVLETGRVRALAVEIDERHLRRYASFPTEVYELLAEYGFSPRFGLRSGHYDEIFERIGSGRMHEAGA